MTKKGKKYITDFIIKNQITDYHLINELIAIIELEEKLLNAKKEAGLYYEWF